MYNNTTSLSLFTLPFYSLYCRQMLLKNKLDFKTFQCFLVLLFKTFAITPRLDRVRASKTLFYHFLTENYINIHY